MDSLEAKRIMGKNFVGKEELNSIGDKLNITRIKDVPEMPFDKSVLEKSADSHLLILGVSKDDKGQLLTINQFRENFGVDPVKNEPCMYNQDWYLKEKFASETVLENRWYLISKKILSDTRAQDPKEIATKFPIEQNFPSAILTTYTFFANYFLNNEILWKHEFIWCNDTDSNGDRIYTGRYVDPKGINKNGFNIHRHLSIKNFYGLASQII